MRYKIIKNTELSELIIEVNSEIENTSYRPLGGVVVETYWRSIGLDGDLDPKLTYLQTMYKPEAL